jgi:hypothetical protein
VLQKKVQVLYIDYGNEEVIPLDRIHQLHRNIDLFPPCVSSLSGFLTVSPVSCFNVLMGSVFASSWAAMGWPTYLVK